MKRREWFVEFLGVVAIAIALAPHITADDAKTLWRAVVVPSLRDTWRILKGGTDAD